MAVLGYCKPVNVFRFFEEICSIPHGSGNTAQISEYLKNFALERGLKYHQDRLGDVLIYKDATPGYENEEPIIIQGHMDMVAVSDPGADIDMKKDGLKLKVDGDYVMAEGTSLGADDGIALAYALAILDDDAIKHPPIEFVATIDEETGMDGAAEFDVSLLSGRRFLNIDNEVEGQFITGCAGGGRANIELSYKKEAITEKDQLVKIVVNGCMGGHSGTEIDKGRANPNILEGRILYELAETLDFIQFVSLKGGLADNAIPRESEMIIAIPQSDSNEYMPVLVNRLAKIATDIKTEYSTVEADMVIAHKVMSTEACAISYKATYDETNRIAAFLHSLPYGIQAMSADVKGLVETSLNLGIAKTTETELIIRFAVRSSIESAKMALFNKLIAIAKLAGANASISGLYPGWKYRVDSPFRDKMVRVYKETFNELPAIEAIHAGLECGFFSNKIDDLDCVSIGPNIYDIHTTREHIQISSVARVWDYLIKLLEDKDVK